MNTCCGLRLLVLRPLITVLRSQQWSSASTRVSPSSPSPRSWSLGHCNLDKARCVGKTWKEKWKHDSKKPSDSTCWQKRGKSWRQNCSLGNSTKHARCRMVLQTPRTMWKKNTVGKAHHKSLFYLKETSFKNIVMLGTLSFGLCNKTTSCPSLVLRCLGAPTNQPTHPQPTYQPNRPNPAPNIFEVKRMTIPTRPQKIYLYLIHLLPKKKNAHKKKKKNTNTPKKKRITTWVSSSLLPEPSSQEPSLAMFLDLFPCFGVPCNAILQLKGLPGMQPKRAKLFKGPWWRMDVSVWLAGGFQSRWKGEDWRFERVLFACFVLGRCVYIVSSDCFRMVVWGSDISTYLL